MRNETFNGSYGNGFFSVLKAAGLALAFSFLSTVVFACILRAAALSDSVIYPINQIVKVLAIVLGVMAFVRGEKGWLKGGGAALLFTALSYLAFSAIGGDFSLSWLIFAELLWTVGAGVLAGIFAVNFRS